MPRPHRIEFPGAFYHVFARGNNKQKLFHETQDYTVYLDRIERYHNRYNFILYAYALMSNHIHFAIETSEIPLSKIMQGIQQSYSQYVHKKYSYVGHLYQGPYGAVLYEKEESVLNLVRYIHRNPIEACLVENPEHYPWSSHRVYLNMEDCSFLDKNNNILMLRKKTLPEILKIVSKQTKVSADSILSQCRLHEITEARRLFTFISAKYAGYRLVEISRILKLDDSTISKMVKKMEDELKHNPILPEKMWKIIHVLQARPRS